MASPLGAVWYKGYTRENALESVGKGWASLINEVFDVYENIKGTIKIVQVKEKWGGLRIYTDYSNSTLDEVIRKVEGLSVTICEDCGNAGKIIGTGWYRTLCTNCEENQRRQHDKAPEASN